MRGFFSHLLLGSVNRIEGMEGKHRDYLEFKAHQAIKFLYKDFIYMLEDMLEDGAISEERFYKTRKRVLDKGNDCIRGFTEELDRFAAYEGD